MSPPERPKREGPRQTFKYRAVIKDAKRPDGWPEVYYLGRIRASDATTAIQERIDAWNGLRPAEEHRTLVSVEGVDTNKAEENRRNRLKTPRTGKNRRLK